MNSFVCSFIHSFFLSFIDSLIHCWRYALMGCLMDSLTRCIHWIVHSCVRTFVFVVAWFRSSAQFVHSSIQSCIDPFIHSFTQYFLHFIVRVISFHFIISHSCMLLSPVIHSSFHSRHSCMHACMHAFSISYLYSSFISSCLFISFRCISCPSSLPSFIQPSLISHMHIHKQKKQHHMRRTCKHSLYVCTYTQTYLPTNLHAGLAACMHAAACIRLPDLRII